LTRYRVRFENEALGHLARLVEARSAADAIMWVVREALAPCCSTVWDAPLVNFGCTVTVEPVGEGETS